MVDEEQRTKTLVTVQPGALPGLRHGEVQVFRVWAMGDAEQFALAMSVLSPEERERAARYRVERAREEFVVGRAALRVLLGAALGIAPRDVELTMNRCGKPESPGIEFNVAHSRGLIYVALSRDVSVGVDVEWIDPELEVMELAEPNFAAEEAQRLALLPEGLERATAFYRVWTQKEAAAKADGRGLGIALRKISLPRRLPGQVVILDEGDESVVTRQGLPLKRMECLVRELWAPDGFAAALSVRDSNSPIVRCFFLLDLGASGVS